MKFLILLIFYFNLSLTFAQIRRDAVWCFGDSVQIDFNQQSPVISSCSTVGRGTACSIADSLGNLLFYSHTFYVPMWLSGADNLGIIWNSNGGIMQNGDSIIGEAWYQEMVIVPYPGNSNLYYLFHTGVISYGEIYYSLIDISLNNGLGKVIQKNILLDSLNGAKVTDGITAIKQGNGRDWWLIFRIWDGAYDNKFYKFLVTPSGISGPLIQNIGMLSSTNTIRLRFNNRGNKFVVLNNYGLLELFDFDRCTGQISNPQFIWGEDGIPEHSFWSAAFSPNDSLLYVGTNQLTSYLYQLNLSDSNIYLHRYTVDIISYPVGAGGDIKLAPNGSIYWACAWSDSGQWNFPYPDTAYVTENMNLSVISNPNNLGVQCNYQRYGFYLENRRTYWGLPNNPNYDLLALGGSICDSLGLPNHVSIYKSSSASLKIFYQPDWKVAFINASSVKGKNYSLHIVAMNGSEIYSENGFLSSEYFTKDFHCDKLSSGTYMVLIVTEKERLVKKFIID